MAHVALNEEQIKELGKDFQAISKSISDLLYEMGRFQLTAVNMDYKTAVRHITWLKNWAEKAVNNAKTTGQNAKMQQILKAVEKKD